MKRQRIPSEREKRTGESSLAPLGMNFMASWSWDELIDGFSMNSFKVKPFYNELATPGEK